jgi:peptidylprolyl isomerase
VSRRLRRLPTVLLPLVLLTGLAACGDANDGASSSSSGSGALEAVTISGEPGAAPKVSWEGEMSSDKLETEVLEEGDGAEVEDGDKVFTHIWIGNGFTQKKSFSTYDQKKPELVTVDENLIPVFGKAMQGQKLGSRVAVTAPADEAFGPQGNPQLNIANKDAVLVIVDLISIQEVLDGPQGSEQKAPAWAPGLTEKDGNVTALDFAGAPRPDGKLRSAALIEGDGAVVKSGQTITVDYLGQVYRGKKPFDESFSKEPASFAIGTGGVIPGWDKTLVGAKVGSRVMLAIPPKDGYGEAGNESAGIKGTDTLYFVVDILSAD